MAGRKIIDGLKEALGGNFTRVTIEGQHWVREDALRADLQAIMGVNNKLRDLLNEAVETPGTSEDADWCRRVREAVTPN